MMNDFWISLLKKSWKSKFYMDFVFLKKNPASQMLLKVTRPAVLWLKRKWL